MMPMTSPDSTVRVTSSTAVTCAAPFFLASKTLLTLVNSMRVPRRSPLPLAGLVPECVTTKNHHFFLDGKRLVAAMLAGTKRVSLLACSESPEEYRKRSE